MQVDVLCIGQATVDLITLVENFPTENSKSETRDLIESGGGPAANAAYLLSSWGLACAFAGVVGDDQHASQIVAEFQTVGTNLSLLETRHACKTPLSVILVNTLTGSRTIINRKTTTAPLRLNAGTARDLTPRLLLFDGHEFEASLEALDLFPQATSILDAGSLRPSTRELAGKVDYLAASERFALQTIGPPELSNESNQRLCLAKLKEMFQTTVIVTLGEKGLIADNGTGFQFMPAFPAKAVDTTAAGDIFHGAFACAIARDLPFAQSLRLASMAASLSVRVPGGRTSIPKLETVKEALAHAA